MRKLFSRSTYPQRVAGITLFGLLLRLLFINQQPFWRDEAFTGLAVRRSLGDMLSVLAHDSAPPLFYLVERFVALFSTAPFALRLYPVLAGVVAIPLSAALGRRLAGNAGGLAAGLLAALAPYLLLTSLNARMYQPALTLILAALLCLLRARERPSLARWALYATFSILALYTVYFAIFPLLAALLAVLLLPGGYPKRTRLAILATTALSLLATIPWLLYARSQFSHHGFWVPPETLSNLFGGLVQFFTGSGSSANLTTLSPAHLLTGLLLLAGILLTLCLAYRLYRHPPASSSPALLLGAIGLIGLSLIFVVSLWRPIEDARFLGVAWVPLYPLFAAELTRLRLPHFPVLGPSLLLATSLALPLTLNNPATSLALADLSQSKPPPTVVYATPATYLLLIYYAPPALADHFHVLGQSVLWFWGTAVYPPHAILARLEQSAPGQPIWMVSAPHEKLPGPLSRYTLLHQTCYPGICTLELAVPQPSRSTAASAPRPLSWVPPPVHLDPRCLPSPS